MIAIIDYGMGNLRSVQKALEAVTPQGAGSAQAQIVSDPETLRTADKVVLPGVGAFNHAMSELRRLGLDDALREHVGAGKPLLGVCLGLQLLLDVSEEDGEHAGLGLIPGRVVRFADGLTAADGARLKVPHMGWNAVNVRRRNLLLDGIADGTYFYFVHSYYAEPAADSDVALTAEHGRTFCAMLARDNVFATQFHPEKSQQDGLRIYENFTRL